MENMKVINKCIFIAYIVISLTPILANNYLQIALMALWIMTSLGVCRELVLDWKISIVVWILYAIVLRAINFSTATWGNYGTYLLFYFPLFAFSFYLRYYERKDINQLTYVIVAVFLINMIHNIYLLYLNPGATVELNFSDIYTGMNIGNSNFTFAVMLVLLMCWWKALYGSRILLVASVLGVIYLIMSSKTTAFLVFAVFAFLMLIEKFYKRIRRTQRIVLMTLTVVLVPFVFYVALPLLENIIHNDYINARINALIARDAESIYLARIQLAQISWDTFVHHPIFGIGYVKADFSKIIYYTTGIGHHSELIDHLGRYGIVGAAFYVYIFRKFWLFLREIAGDVKNWLCANYVFIAFIVFSFLNNSMDALSGIVLFFLIPSFCNAHAENEPLVYDNVILIKGENINHEL